MSEAPRFAQVPVEQFNDVQKRVAERVLKVSSAGLGGPYAILLRSPVLLERYLGMVESEFAKLEAENIDRPAVQKFHGIQARNLGKMNAASVRITMCRHIYPRVGRGAVAIFDVADNNALHRILNEWADIIPAQFETYPLVDLDSAQRVLAGQVAAKKDSP